MTNRDLICFWDLDKQPGTHGQNVEMKFPTHEKCRQLRRLKGYGSDLFGASLLRPPQAASWRVEFSDHSRFDVTPTDFVFSPDRDTAGSMTLTATRPHLTLTPTGLSTRRKAPLPSRLLGFSSCGASFILPLYRCSPPVCLPVLFFYARSSGFITGFEEPASALPPTSGSLRSSSSQYNRAKLVSWMCECEFLEKFCHREEEEVAK